MAYEITKNFISMNRSGKALTAIGTVVHETATPGASDEDEFRYFNSGAGGRSASAHAFVDYDSITQIIPWNEQAWHAGRTANRSYIGIELCNYNDSSKFEEIWKRGVWLFAWLHVNVINVTTINKITLMSHAEVSQKWGETDHSDPVVYFAKFGRTVDMFRAEVQSEIDRMLNKDGSEPQPPTIPGRVAGANSDVLELQKLFNRLEIRDHEGKVLEEDGSFGPRTTQAAKRFQQVAGITVDGKVGKQTMGAINAILAKPVLRVGSTGIAVRYVQFRTGTNVDGDFGSKTNAAVKSFQSSNGLSADGIVGPLTWGKLIG